MPTLFWRMLDSLPSSRSPTQEYEREWSKWFEDYFNLRGVMTINWTPLSAVQYQGLQSTLWWFSTYLKRLRECEWSHNDPMFGKEENGEARRRRMHASHCIYKAYFYALWLRIDDLGGNAFSAPLRPAIAAQLATLVSKELRVDATSNVVVEIVGAMRKFLTAQCGSTVNPSAEPFPLNLLCSVDSVRRPTAKSLPTGAGTNVYCQLPITPSLTFLIPLGAEVKHPSEYVKSEYEPTALQYQALKRYESAASISPSELPIVKMRAKSNSLQIVWSVFLMYLEFVLQDLECATVKGANAVNASIAAEPRLYTVNDLAIAIQADAPPFVHAQRPFDSRVDVALCRLSSGRRQDSASRFAPSSDDADIGDSESSFFEALECEQENPGRFDAWELTNLHAAFDGASASKELTITFPWVELNGEERYGLHLVIVKEGASRVEYPAIEFVQDSNACDEFTEVCITSTTPELSEVVDYAREHRISPRAMAVRRSSGSGVDIYVAYVGAP